MKTTANYRLSSHKTLSPDFKDKKVLEILGKKRLKDKDCQFDFICLTKNGECLVIEFNKDSIFGSYLIRQNFYFVDSLNIYNENDVFKVVPPKQFQQDLKIDTIKWICDQANKAAQQTKMLQINDSLHNETCSRSFISILEKHYYYYNYYYLYKQTVFQQDDYPKFRYLLMLASNITIQILAHVARHWRY